MLRRVRGAICVLAGLFVLATAALASAGAAQAVTSPTGSIGVRLLDTPAAPADPRARLYIVNRLAPGAQVTQHIELSNTSLQPVTVSVYASAAAVNHDAFTWSDGKAANELTSWTTLNAATVTIPARGTAIEAVRIRLPSKVSTGERYGVIWAQVASKATATGNVELVNRVGVRMYVSVGEGNIGAAGFTLTNLEGHRTPKGIPSVTATVHNSGGRALDLNGNLSLSEGPGGLGAGPIKVTDSSTIAAGETRAITVPLAKGLPDGPWRATLGLSAAGLNRQISAPVTFVSPSPKTSLAKILLLIGGPLVLIAIIVFVDRQRRRRRPPPQLRAIFQTRASSLR